MVSWFSTLMCNSGAFTPVFPRLAVFGQQVARFEALGERKVPGAIAGSAIGGVLHDGPGHATGCSMSSRKRTPGISCGVITQASRVTGHPVRSPAQADAGPVGSLHDGGAFHHGVEGRSPFCIGAALGIGDQARFQVASM